MESLWLFSTGRCCAAHPVLPATLLSHRDSCLSQCHSSSSSLAQPWHCHLPELPTGHGLSTAVPQPSMKASHRNAETKPGVAQELHTSVIWSACLIFSCLCFTLAFPCLALLLFFTLFCPSLPSSLYLTSTGSQCRELDLSWTRFLPISLFLTSPAFIFPLLLLLRVPHLPLLKREKKKKKKCNSLSFANHSGISQWELGLPGSEAHKMTGSPQGHSAWAASSPSPCSDGFWLLGPAPGAPGPALPDSSRSQFQTLCGGTGTSLRPVVELCSSKLYRNPTVHPQGAEGAGPAQHSLGGALWGYHDSGPVFSHSIFVCWNVADGGQWGRAPNVLFPLC